MGCLQPVDTHLLLTMTCVSFYTSAGTNADDDLPLMAAVTAFLHTSQRNGVQAARYWWVAMYALGSPHDSHAHYSINIAPLWYSLNALPPLPALNRELKLLQPGKLCSQSCQLLHHVILVSLNTIHPDPSGAVVPVQVYSGVPILPCLLVHLLHPVPPVVAEKVVSMFMLEGCASQESVQLAAAIHEVVLIAACKAVQLPRLNSWQGLVDAAHTMGSAPPAQPSS